MIRSESDTRQLRRYGDFMTTYRSIIAILGVVFVFSGLPANALAGQPETKHVSIMTMYLLLHPPSNNVTQEKKENLPKEAQQKINSIENPLREALVKRNYTVNMLAYKKYSKPDKAQDKAYKVVVLVFGVHPYKKAVVMELTAYVPPRYGSSTQKVPYIFHSFYGYPHKNIPSTEQVFPKFLSVLLSKMAAQ